MRFTETRCNQLTQCLCLDPNPPTTTTTKKPDCGAKKFKSDGQCDDNNNLMTCDWDGGDCCDENFGKSYYSEVCWHRA